MNGFLGPNAFKAFRVEIDYAGSAVYFEKSASSIRSSTWISWASRCAPRTTGATRYSGSREGREGRGRRGRAGGQALQIGDLETTGATMGTVVDALRGKPGDIRVLILEREGKRFRVETRVERYL